jgi:hypothetical protein
MINSYATYRNSQSCHKERAFYRELGGSIDVELLSENHHKRSLTVGEDLLLNEGVVPLLWITSYIASLSELISDWPKLMLF